MFLLFGHGKVGFFDGVFFLCREWRGEVIRIFLLFF